MCTWVHVCTWGHVERGKAPAVYYVYSKWGLGIIFKNLLWQKVPFWVLFSFWTIGKDNHSSFIDAKEFFTVIYMGYKNAVVDILFLGGCLSDNCEPSSIIYSEIRQLHSISEHFQCIAYSWSHERTAKSRQSCLCSSSPFRFLSWL